MSTLDTLVRLLNDGASDQIYLKKLLKDLINERKSARFDKVAQQAIITGFCQSTIFENNSYMLDMHATVQIPTRYSLIKYIATYHLALVRLAFQAMNLDLDEDQKLPKIVLAPENYQEIIKCCKDMRDRDVLREYATVPVKILFALDQNTWHHDSSLFSRPELLHYIASIYNPEWPKHTRSFFSFLFFKMTDPLLPEKGKEYYSAFRELLPHPLSKNIFDRISTMWNDEHISISDEKKSTGIKELVACLFQTLSLSADNHEEVISLFAKEFFTREDRLIKQNRPYEKYPKKPTNCTFLEIMEIINGFMHDHNIENESWSQYQEFRKTNKANFLEKQKNNEQKKQEREKILLAPVQTLAKVGNSIASFGLELKNKTSDTLALKSLHGFTLHRKKQSHHLSKQGQQEPSMEGFELEKWDEPISRNEKEKGQAEKLMESFELEEWDDPVSRKEKEKGQSKKL
jgi:hypothetical protein